MTNQAGVHFSKYGIAFTKPLMGSRRENFSDLNGFSLEIALKPANSNKGRFGFILAIHSGDDSEQLVIGQWRSWEKIRVAS